MHIPRLTNASKGAQLHDSPGETPLKTTVSYDFRQQKAQVKTDNTKAWVNTGSNRNSHTAGGSINWNHHHGTCALGLLEHALPPTQRFCSWAYTQQKCIHVFNKGMSWAIHSSAIQNSPKWSDSDVLPSGWLVIFKDGPSTTVHINTEESTSILCKGCRYIKDKNRPNKSEVLEIGIEVTLV